MAAINDLQLDAHRGQPLDLEQPNAASAAAPAAARAPRAGGEAIDTPAYGKFGNDDVELHTLTNKSGLVLKIATYGAMITEFHVPDRNGKLADIVLGYDDFEGYRTATTFFGAIVGRVANRIGHARFQLEGKEYRVAATDGDHHLHGGVKGFDKVVWQAEPLELVDGPALRLRYVSKDGEEGYPGTVTATTTYTLTQQNELKVVMEAETDATTIVNLAHHSYWNLGGPGSGLITDHELMLYADQYTPGEELVPTGEIAPVKGTPFDFTRPKPIGRDLAAVGGTPVGYDHNFVVNGAPTALRPVARVKDPKSGRVMTLMADQPGVQLYSGNFLKGKTRGKGTLHAQYSGFCLETQKFPNAINIPGWKEQVILRPGQRYEHTMIHGFSAE